MSQTIDGYGSAITSTNVGGAVTSGGKQGLDVAIISGSVTITGTITTDDLIHTDDSVRLGDGTDLLSFGQQLMSASLPVVIASDQSVISVSGTISANQSGTWNINNISGTISLPTGAATETTLSTLNTKIPSNLTVTSTRLLVDGSSVTQPVSGSVTVSGTVAATQSGTWNIASITTGVVAGTNANNLGKAEDARHSDGDTGVFMLGVRQDTLASSVNADSDYAGIKLNSLGAIYVEPRQKTHDNLNLNANLQINNTDVSSSNGVPNKVADGASTSTSSITTTASTVGGVTNQVALAIFPIGTGDYYFNLGGTATTSNAIINKSSPLVIEDYSGTVSLIRASGSGSVQITALTRS